VAVYGRRRIGKTYLIREFFKNTFTFQLTGIANVEMLQQLGNFRSALIRYFPELEESNFITKYNAFGKNTRNQIYQLIDFYSLFYIRFIKNSDIKDKNFWINSLDSPEVRAWSGYAFEQICFSHLDEIRKALGIAGVQTNSSAWIGNNGTNKAQIDLVIDRRDQVINLCEAKICR
jgi:uncharacterized protein